jgi:hypothetical protein
MNRRGIPIAPARSARQWARIVENWNCSRQTISDFCAARKLKEKTFRWYRWALKARGPHPHRQSSHQDGESPSMPSSVVAQKSNLATPAFVEVVRRVTLPVTPERRSSGVEVVVPRPRRDCRIRIDTDFDRATLRRVLSILEEV